MILILYCVICALYAAGIIHSYNNDHSVEKQNKFSTGEVLILFALSGFWVPILKAISDYDLSTNFKRDDREHNEE